MHMGILSWLPLTPLFPLTQQVPKPCHIIFLELYASFSMDMEWVLHPIFTMSQILLIGATYEQ